MIELRIMTLLPLLPVTFTPPGLVPVPLFVIVVALMVPWPILNPTPVLESIVEFSIVTTDPGSEPIVAAP